MNISKETFITMLVIFIISATIISASGVVFEQLQEDFEGNLNGTCLNVTNGTTDNCNITGITLGQWIDDASIWSISFTSPLVSNVSVNVSVGNSSLDLTDTTLDHPKLTLVFENASHSETNETVDYTLTYKESEAGWDANAYSLEGSQNITELFGPLGVVIAVLILLAIIALLGIPAMRGI